MFVPARLEAARKRRGLTKADLASLALLSVRSIQAYESGAQAPTPASIERLAKALKYPAAYFERTHVPEIPAAAVSFRSVARLPAADRDAAIAMAQGAVELAELLSRHVPVWPEWDTEPLTEFDFNAEHAARYLRATWGLDERPIPNIIELVESKGVRVLSLGATGTSNVDAFCFYRNRTPYILVNTLKSAERTRFDIGHELSHIVHDDAGQVGHDKDVETRANAFAAAFLMPATAVRDAVGNDTSLRKLMAVKKVFRVSLAALIRRLRDLKMLTEWHYREYVIALAAHNHDKSEPEPVSPDTATHLTGALRRALTKGVTVSQLAAQLQVPANEVSSVLYGLGFPVVVE